jgi:DNA-binding MarR family transcriptional regulator
MQFVLLTTVRSLGEHEEPLTQQRIAEHAGTDVLITGQVLRRLAARQLISREPDDHDPRARRIVLTDAGCTVVTGALSDVAATDAEFFATLGPDAPVFLRGLTALRDTHR